MRMLAKYTAFIDFDKDGNKIDESFYLSFVRGEDVMDIPFDSFQEMKKFTDKYSLASHIRTSEFLDKIKAYDDYRDFFKDVDILVIYNEAVAVNFNEILDRGEKVDDI